MKMGSIRLTLPVLGLVLAMGCGGGDDFGIVVAEWSVDGLRAPDACARIGAVFFEAVFFARDDVFAGEAEERCERFQVTLELEEGQYDVHTRLITAGQEAVSETLFFDDVRVDEDRGAVLHSDFTEPPLP